MGSDELSATEPAVDSREAGFKSLYKAWKMVKEKNPNDTVVVVDADEVLMEPAEMLAKYCAASGLGPEIEDIHNWEPRHIPEWDTWKGWHDDALDSTGLLKKPTPSSPPKVEDLPKEIQKLINEALPLYEEMLATSIKPTCLEKK